MFGWTKKEDAAPVQAAPSYASYPTAPMMAPMPSTQEAAMEPDWTQMGAFHQAPVQAYVAVAEGAGADFSMPQPVPTAPEPVTVVTATDAPDPSEAEAVIQIEILPTRYLQERVRSGVTVEAEGDLIIHGEVSSGAEIIAGGNVHILGTCKGRVKAGAAIAGRAENPDARIFLYRCQAELVSIGGRYQCFEHMPAELDNRAVVFSLNGQRLAAVPLV